MSKPKHHLRESVCATRPPYREGRKSKAVKVYTVHQESRYLLVQGIPAVGTANDLVTLFSSHGEIAEHRMLDDYPAEQFTDVCLIKYQRIQSARQAKRRLDDWSFFGGVLHVCYAPEYETVKETREKLQDRRKTIAAKVRQYSTDGTYEQNYKESPRDQRHVTESVRPVGIQHKSITAATGTSQTGSLAVHGPRSLSYINEAKQTSYASNAVQIQRSQFSTGSDLHISHNDVFDVREQNKGNQSVKTSEEEERLWLPPPPKQIRLSHLPEDKKANHKFGLGPSAQAEFPPDFDARTDQPSGVTLTEFLSRKGPNAAREDTEETTTKSMQDKIEENLKSSNLIIKQIPKKSSVPKFIPRQTQAKFKPKASHLTRAVPTATTGSEATVTKDTLNTELKKHAFTLGKQQGPVEPDEHNRTRPGPEEVSVQKSVKQIRDKLSQATKEMIKDR